MATAMEVDSLQLTIEDILLRHRAWITKLFFEDKKTEVEIVRLLYERRFSVTLDQLRKQLREWDLLSSSSPSTTAEPELDVLTVFTSSNTDLHIDTRSISDSWELIHPCSNSPSRRRLSTASDVPPLPDSPTYTPSPISAEFDAPKSIDLYQERPLPSLPTTSKLKRKSSTALDRPSKDKLKVTCHHGSEFHEVEMTLGILGQEGPSPIETYASDDQSHERIAIGLERKPDLSIHEQAPNLPFRKAGQWRGSGNSSRKGRDPTKTRRRKLRKEDETRSTT